MLTEVFYLHEKGSLADARLCTYILDDSDSIAIEKRPMMLICPGGGYEGSRAARHAFSEYWLSCGSAALFGGTGSLSDGPVRGSGVHEADS